MDEASIRKNLRKARNSLGYTQAELAESLDISVTAYQKIENGKTRILNPNFSKCAGTLGMSLSELVNGFDPVENAEALVSDVRETYVSRVKELEKEIAGLKRVIKDKDDTIETQKLLISHLMTGCEV